MKRKALALTLIMALLISSVAGIQSYSLPKANPYIRLRGQPPDNAKPSEITILSPINNTVCNPNKVSFSFSVTGDLFLSRVYYEADSQQNAIVVYQYSSPDPSNPLPNIYDFSYDQSITGIPEGKHSIVITILEWGSYIDGAYSIEFSMNASSSINFVADYAPPQVSGFSIENTTYPTSDLPLNFTVNEDASKISYVIDGLENVTVDGNTTLTNLANGKHNVTVYATDEAGNVGASETLYFTVEVPEPFPTALVIASIVTVAVVGIGLLVYFKKRKHQSIPSSTISNNN